MKNAKHLYEEINKCHKCKLMDSKKALRKIESTNLHADVFIISQALARNALRKSGISFYKEDGKLCSTGKRLEQFLKKFDRTTDYKSRKCVYNTEITQCYPGKKNNGDRPPSRDEVVNCLPFLLKEIDLIKPKLILLMGVKSRNAFYKYVLNKKEVKNFAEDVGFINYYRDNPVIPIYHASSANRHFEKMINDAKLINKIRRIIKK